MTGVVIVGGSIAGIRVAQSLRSQGYTAELTIVTDEDCPPYDRPPLSKALLADGASPDDIRLLTDSDLASLDVRLVTGVSATRLDLAGRELTLDESRVMSYTDLVIATGCSAVVPPWARLDGVHFLRTLSDALGLRDAFDNGGRLTIVGAGFIGCEVAAIARAHGLDVWLVDPMHRPMARALDELTGDWFTRLHAGHRVRMVLGTGVRALEARGQGFGVRLDSGLDLDVDSVLVGVGARPNTGWLESSGLSLDDGVLCDRYGRALGAHNVYAIGDVARWDGDAVQGPTRHEHWTNAVDQANCVAHNILAPAEPLTNSAVPYVWTDQYDWKAQIVGTSTGTHRVVLGNPFEGRAVALYGDGEGVMTGGVIVNWPQAMVACRRAVGNRSPVAEVASGLERKPTRSRS